MMAIILYSQLITVEHCHLVVKQVVFDVFTSLCFND